MGVKSPKKITPRTTEPTIIVSNSPNRSHCLLRERIASALTTVITKHITAAATKGYTNGKEPLI
jgi:hypothetical protein